VSGLGERGTRVRRVAAQLQPPPIAVFYVQTPDEVETRAVGWYMRLTRKGEPIYLGHSAAAAEQWLREQLPKRRRSSVRKTAKKKQSV
jgi:hypothetical protein